MTQLEPKEIIKREKHYCGNCEKDTNHGLLFVKKIVENPNNYPEEYAPDFATDYMVLQCYGCEQVSFLKRFIDNETNYMGEGAYIDDTIYPPIIKNHRKLDNSHYLPDKIQTIYNETIK